MKILATSATALRGLRPYGLTDILCYVAVETSIFSLSLNAMFFF
jgi:hypothetical protein